MSFETLPAHAWRRAGLFRLAVRRRRASAERLVRMHQRKKAAATAGESRSGAREAAWPTCCIFSRRASARRANRPRLTKPWKPSKSAWPRLPDDQREAVRLRYLGGQSLEETAKEMQRSPGAVRGLLHRARKRSAKVCTAPRCG